uniref:Nuclear transcription factor Y subunit n=1 Tax=Oryza punctata TaxID=4537 RepID=A0A0E0M7E0_ORYPU
MRRRYSAGRWEERKRGRGKLIYIGDKEGGRTTEGVPSCKSHVDIMGVGESNHVNQSKLDGLGEVSTDLSLANQEANSVHPKPEHIQPLKHIPTKGMRHILLLPLPTEHADDEPVYVNAKQYHAILRRRQRRKIIGSEDKVATIRKRILVESRQKQAKLRRRGKGGRFISTEHPLEPYVDDQLSKNGGKISPCTSTTSENSSNVIRDGLRTSPLMTKALVRDE